jgi:Domain of unknown function (DUF4055)
VALDDGTTVPIDTQHPTYGLALPIWKKVRDVIQGQRAVHNATTDYLPRLSGQTADSYRNYVLRADFVAFTQRTHYTLAGFLFRKDPVFKFPDTLADFMMDATLSGVAYYDWLKDTARAVLGVGRRGTLIDWNEQLKRPFLSVYEAEQIINWKVGKVDDQLALTLLVLAEESCEPSPLAGEDPVTDEFEHKVYPQWRVYELLQDTVGGDWYVRCQVWRKKLGGTASTAKGDAPGTGAPPSGPGQSRWALIEETYPARGGITLGRIPFVFHGPNNHLPAIDQSPMEPMADVNLSHYRTGADLAHGLHFVALPTPTARGYGEDADKLPIGPEIAWVSDKPYAAAAYLEFSGAGLGAVDKELQNKQERMAGLGARMFDSPSAQGRRPEAYDTVRIRQTGETVTLVNVAIALMQSGSDVLQWAAWWLAPRTVAAPEDLTEVATVELTTDFVQADVQPDELTSYVTAWQAMAISHRTMYYRLEKSEFYPPDWTYEEELKAIVEGSPTMAVPGPDTSGGTSAGPNGAQSGSQGGSQGGGGGGGGRADRFTSNASDLNIS